MTSGDHAFKLLDDTVKPVKEFTKKEGASDKGYVDPFIEISKSTAQLIKNSGSRFTIGIYGEWGTGKTTLMKQIEDHLNSFTRDEITLSWNNLLHNDSNVRNSEFSKLRDFLEYNYNFGLSWLKEDSELQYKQNDGTITIVNKNIKNGKSPKYSQMKKKLFSTLSFWFNNNSSKTIYEVEKNIDAISIKLNKEKNKATLKVGDLEVDSDVEKENDGKLRLHLKEKEILTVWFDAWRYEQEEHFALIALMKTIAYAMGGLPYYQKVKEVLLRGLGIIGKDILRQLATQFVMTNEGFSEFDKKLLPQMDLLSQVDKETIYFNGLQKIRDEMKNISNTYKIVIFIDDLDRCNAKKALEVFESTKAFLDIEGFIFVMGLSIDTLYKLVTKEYEGIEIKGEEYIRKIIQVYINLPTWKDLERIEKLVEDISCKLGEEERYRKLFQDTELIAMAANYNPREVKRLINRFTISSYLDEINATIFLIIQAFENRWYEDLYKRLEGSDYRKKLLKLLDEVKPTIEGETRKSSWDYFKRKKEEVLQDNTRPLPEDEKALLNLNEAFWEFVDKGRQINKFSYYDKIIDVIENWGRYKETYRKSAEPTEHIKYASKQIRQDINDINDITDQEAAEVLRFPK